MTETRAPHTQSRSENALVRVVGVRKTYGKTVAVRGADLTLQPGTIHALCGHNGAGKSTVVRMLSGQEMPDAGTIAVAGQEHTFKTRRDAQRAGISLVDQELSTVAALSVTENLFLGDRETGWLSRPRQLRRQARELLDSMGLSHVRPEQPLASLGLGERQLVEIARALGQQARLVILDEPTATLSDSESAHVYSAVRRVAAAGCAVLFVSHRLGEVLDLCDEVTVMRDGAVVVSTAASELTVSTLITHMLGEPPRPAVRIDGSAERRDVVLEVTGLCVPGSFSDFSMIARAGSVYAVAGQLGSGASEVLRSLAGLEPGATGEVTIAHKRLKLGHPISAGRAGVAFASNDRKSEGLFLNRTVGTNLLATRIPAVTRRGTVQRRRWRDAERSAAATCGFDRARVDARVGDLSGGNQQKAFVGRSLGRPDVRLLMLDEPTRGVDVGGRAAIHELVRTAADDGMAVIFSSTELDELTDLADVVITMYKGSVVALHPGVVSSDALLYEMTHGNAQVNQL
jgi:ABC-type sugar transport system ATPase subunit